METDSKGGGVCKGWEETANAALKDLLVHLSKIKKTEDKLIWILKSVNKCCNYSIETVHRLEDELILVKDQLKTVKESDKVVSTIPKLEEVKSDL